MNTQAADRSRSGQPRPMPTVYLPHGAGPCFFMDWNPPDAWDRTAQYLKGIGASLPETPKAILMVSAHWLESSFTSTSHPQPAMIYDYYGFPPHTYELKYPAPGRPELATRVTELLSNAQLPCAEDPQRGFDHGMFIPLLLMYPGADIPVVQLSLRNDLDPAAHLKVGAALAPLRDEGVLIVGSGMSFHNMRGFGDPRSGPASDEFDRWLTAAVALTGAQRVQALTHWDQAPGARLSHPLHAEEHFIPLLVAAGAAADEPGRHVFTDRVLEVTLSAYHFGS